MDESQNNQNDNNLDLVPPEENPLQEAPKAETDGAIGASLDPSSFGASSDPLLNGNLKAEPAVPVEPIPLTEEKPTKSKIAHKGLFIGIGITALNLIICTIAVILCLNISKSTNPSKETIVQKDDFPNSLQCKVDNCISELKFDDTIDQITNRLGIKPSALTSASYILSDNITLNVKVGQYPSFDYELKKTSLLKDSKFTTEQFEQIKDHAYSYKTKDGWKLEDVEKLIGKGTLKSRSKSTTTYIWVNRDNKTYFTLTFDGKNYYSQPTEKPFNIYE